MATSTCVIEIIRGSGYADWIRSYAILVNDEVVGTIARNSTLCVDVPSGPLKIEARLDWGNSAPLTIDAEPGQTVRLEVANHWGALLALWAITFGRKSYLTLTRLPSN